MITSRNPSGGERTQPSAAGEARSTWKPFPLHKPFFFSLSLLVFPWISLTHLYSLRNHHYLVRGERGRRRREAWMQTLPNPEVIAAGGLPAWPRSHRVGTPSRLYTTRSFQSFPVAWRQQLPGMRNNNFIYVAERFQTAAARKELCLFRRLISHRDKTLIECKM